MPQGNFVPRPGAYTELLSSPEVADLVDSVAAGTASNAGPGFEWNSRQGTRRWRAIVYPATHSARARNASSNSLVHALGSVTV